MFYEYKIMKCVSKFCQFVNRCLGEEGVKTLTNKAETTQQKHGR